MLYYRQGAAVEPLVILPHILVLPEQPLISVMAHSARYNANYLALTCRICHVRMEHA